MDFTLAHILFGNLGPRDVFLAENHNSVSIVENYIDVDLSWSKYNFPMPTIVRPSNLLLGANTSSTLFLLWHYQAGKSILVF